MRKWRCKICGYIHEGDAPPDICPVCGATADEFKVMEEFLEQSPKAIINRIIIIGNGAAGIEAARTIRSQNKRVEILILAEEPYSFYSRIHLSTFIGDESRIEDITIFPQSWYEEQNISVKLETSITEILPKNKQVIDSSGRKYNYDKLILACGASPFQPTLPGMDKKGIFTLRNLKDALEIRKASESCKTAIVVGGGILGIEAASSLRKLGIKTTLIEVAKHLMPFQLDTNAASLLQKILEDRGLIIHCSSRVQELKGNKALTSVLLESGKNIPTDLVLFSTGIKPNIKLAKGAGIKVNEGILVNERMETSEPDILAAGDITEFEGTLYGIWPAAVDQGIIAGANALGISNTYSGNTPLHILKVAGLEMTALGQKSKIQPQDKEIIHMDAKNFQYVKLIHDSQRLKGAIVLGVIGIGFRLEKLIKKQTPIKPLLPDIEKSNWDVLKQKKS